MITEVKHGGCGEKYLIQSNAFIRRSAYMIEYGGPLVLVL